MTLECLISNPLRKQKFHQDCIDLRSLIIICYLRYFSSFDIMLLHLKLQTCFVFPGLISAIWIFIYLKKHYFKTWKISQILYSIYCTCYIELYCTKQGISRRGYMLIGQQLLTYLIADIHTQRNHIKLKRNRKMINTVWFLFNLITFRKYFSVCVRGSVQQCRPCSLYEIWFSLS